MALLIMYGVDLLLEVYILLAGRREALCGVGKDIE